MQSGQFDQSEAVKLIVTFPQMIYLEQIIDQLNQRYCFIQKINKLKSNQLLITFDSMSELLQINFIEEFNAIKTKFQNSDSFCKVMNEEGSNSSDEEMFNYSDKDQKKINFNPQSQTNEPSSLRIIQRMERLTSLEDVVLQQQQLNEKLILFNNNQTLELCGIQQQEDTNNEEILDQPQKKASNDLTQNVWMPILSGVVLTSMMVGGIKIFRNFFN